ncbi:MAG: hypothetical protein ACTSUO_08705 [Candidatus Thorarchaeota archaeon]
MGISSSNNITTEDLERVVLVLTNLESVLKRVNNTLRHKEQIILEKEAVKNKSIEQGLSNAIIILPDNLSSSPCFSNALALFPDTKKPTLLLQKKDIVESKDAYSKIIQLVSARLKEMENRPTLIVNLQTKSLLPILEDKKTIIIGKRFYQDYRQTLDGLIKTMRRHDFQVIEDTGLFGGGTLTYELSNLFKGITVVEITLSQMIVENETNMRRFLGTLSQ